MSKRMVLLFVDEGVSVEAELLEEEAPKTCRAVWDSLPVGGKAVHVICSGHSVYLSTPTPVPMEETENAISKLLPGEIGFFFNKAGKAFGCAEDSSEIQWVYGRLGNIVNADGPCPLNIFARMVGDTAKFFDVCRRMPTEGAKRMEVKRVQE